MAFKPAVTLTINQKQYHYATLECARKAAVEFSDTTMMQMAESVYDNDSGLFLKNRDFSHVPLNTLLEIGRRIGIEDLHRIADAILMGNGVHMVEEIEAYL